MDKLLVTGITGFVGTNLQSYLEGTYEFIGASRNESKEKGLKSYESLTVQDLNEVKVLVHLAGKAHDLKKVSDDQEYYEANTHLTKRLYDLFLESDCEVFIYMSSVKAAADVVEGVLEETTEADPITVYGKSKLEAERYIQANPKEGKRVYILRPCMIHGPGNKGNLNLLYKIISKGIPYPLGAFVNSRSFLSVDNLCFTIKELVERNINSGVYNVADDVSISTEELVRIIGEGINRKAKVVAIPKFFVRFVARIGDVLPLPLSTERLTKLTENYIVSNQKLKKALGKELPLSAKEGLIKTVQSFQND